MQRDNQQCNVFKIAIGMAKTNQDDIGEQCIRNDGSVLAVNDEGNTLERLSY